MRTKTVLSSRMFLKIADCPLKKTLGVLEVTQGRIASRAQKGSHVARFVAVVNARGIHFLVTDGALPVLVGYPLVVFCQGDSIMGDQIGIFLYVLALLRVFFSPLRGPAFPILGASEISFFPHFRRTCSTIRSDSVLGMLVLRELYLLFGRPAFRACFHTPKVRITS